jgi:hypothetical protein
VFNAHQVARVVRDPGFSAGGAGEVAAYMVAPTTCARAAVRMFHTTNAISAKTYLAQSVVGEWTSHPRQSMATNAQRVVDGLDWYIAEDQRDGRPMQAIDETTVVNLPVGGPLQVRLDVVLADGAGVAGRAVFWDGAEFDQTQASVMACAFALGLQQLHPKSTVTTIGIWQARRQYFVEVPYAQAISRSTDAGNVLAGM